MLYMQALKPNALVQEQCQPQVDISNNFITSSHIALHNNQRTVPVVSRDKFRQNNPHKQINEYIQIMLDVRQKI